MTDTITPQVGMAATINLYTDTVAGVVTKVSAKSIVVDHVETGPAERINNPAEPFPVIAEPGILGRPKGQEQRYRFNVKRGRYCNGSVSVTLGQSVRIVDYRY